MYYEKLYVNKPDNLDEMTKDKSSFRWKYPEYFYIYKRNAICKKPPNNKNKSNQNGFFGEFCQTFKKKKKNST